MSDAEQKRALALALIRRALALLEDSGRSGTLRQLSAVLQRIVDEEQDADAAIDPNLACLVAGIPVT